MIPELIHYKKSKNVHSFVNLTDFEVKFGLKVAEHHLPTHSLNTKSLVTIKYYATTTKTFFIQHQVLTIQYRYTVCHYQISNVIISSRSHHRVKCFSLCGIFLFRNCQPMQAWKLWNPISNWLTLHTKYGS